MTKYDMAAEKLRNYIEIYSQFRTVIHPQKVVMAPREFLEQQSILGGGEALRRLLENPEKFHYFFDLLQNEILLKSNKYENCLKPSEGKTLSYKDNVSHEVAKREVLLLKELIILINEIIDIHNLNHESSSKYPIIDVKPLDDALIDKLERPLQESEKLNKGKRYEDPSCAIPGVYEYDEEISVKFRGRFKDFTYTEYYKRNAKKNSRDFSSQERFDTTKVTFPSDDILESQRRYVHEQSKKHKPDDAELESDQAFSTVPSIKKFGAGSVMTWIPETKGKESIVELRIALFEADNNKLRDLTSVKKLDKLSKELDTLSTDAIIQIQKEMRDARFIFVNKDDVRVVSSMVLRVFKDKIFQEIKKIEESKHDVTERKSYLEKTLLKEHSDNIDNIIRAGVADSTIGALNSAKKRVIQSSNFSERIKTAQKGGILR